jgi:ketosteroid isomerase-like protein
MFAHTPEEVHQLFAAAFEAHDLQALVALYAPDAVFLLSPGTMLVRRDAIREHFQTLLALTQRSLASCNPHRCSCVGSARLHLAVAGRLRGADRRGTRGAGPAGRLMR